MNRRQFLVGVVAAPVVAQVGAVERFLVGRYGAPEVGWELAIDPVFLLGAAAFLFGVLEKNVKIQRVADRMAMKMLAPAVAQMGEKL